MCASDVVLSSNGVSMTTMTSLNLVWVSVRSEARIHRRDHSLEFTGVIVYTKSISLFQGGLARISLCHLTHQ